MLALSTRLLLLVILVLPSLAAANQAVHEATGSRVIALPDVSVTGTATLIDGIDLSRHVLSCTNMSGSVAVRWGGSDVAATKGQRIPAGAPVAITTNGAVYMISEAATVIVSCTKEKP